MVLTYQREFTSLSVAAGAVSQISLDPVLQGTAAAIVVTSTQPVVRRWHLDVAG